jgi:hypothetical protein
LLADRPQRPVSSARWISLRSLLRTAVRKSKGLYTDEGRYLDEAAALVRLAELGEDPDCLIAEVTEWLDSSSPQGVTVVAQSERLHGEWLRIEGELRIRTKGGEAEGILRDSKSE